MKIKVISLFILSLLLIAFGVLFQISSDKGGAPLERSGTQIEQSVVFDKIFNKDAGFPVIANDKIKSYEQSKRLEKKYESNLDLFFNTFKTSGGLATTSPTIIFPNKNDKRNDKNQPSKEGGVGNMSILSLMNEKFRNSAYAKNEYPNSKTEDDWLNVLPYNTATEESSYYQTIKNDNKESEELREYGNNLARELNSFRIKQGDQLSKIGHFIKNRDDTFSKDEVVKLSASYEELAESVKNIKTSKDTWRLNQAISDSLRELSYEMSALTQSTDDEEFYKNILKYNKASEGLALNTLRLIDMFKIYGVVFDSSEPGNIFMFK